MLNGGLLAIQLYVWVWQKGTDYSCFRIDGHGSSCVACMLASSWYQEWRHPSMYCHMIPGLTYVHVNMSAVNSCIYMEMELVAHSLYQIKHRKELIIWWIEHLRNLFQLDRSANRHVNNLIKAAVKWRQRIRCLKCNFPEPFFPFHAWCTPWWSITSCRRCWWAAFDFSSLLVQ